MAAKARRSTVSVTYLRAKKRYTADERKKSRERIAKDLTGFSYTANASGAADSVELQLNNRDGKWNAGYMPRKKDKIKSVLHTYYWDKASEKKKMTCGLFLVDSISFSGNTLDCTIGGTSIPEYSSFRATDRRKTWKKAHLKEIGKAIAKRYHMKFYFDGADTSVGTQKQELQTDCEFLTNLCEAYGYGIKLYSGRLVIYSKAKYEAKAPVGTLHKRQCSEQFDWETNLCGTYTGAKIKYTPASTSSKSDTKENSSKSSTKKKKKSSTVITVGKGNRYLTVTDSAESVAQAKKVAAAKANLENEKATTLTVGTRGMLKYSEADTIKLIGAGKLNGKYFIDSITFTKDSSGFHTSMTMHKVQRRITA